MSRTYKTAPYYVKLFSQYNLTLVENHECGKGGECDLPEPNVKSVHENPTSNCSWDYKLIGKNPMCGCPMCTGSLDRKKERRGKRHETKTTLHQITKEVRNYTELDDEELEDNIDFTEPVVSSHIDVKGRESYTEMQYRKQKEAEANTSTAPDTSKVVAES